MGKKRKSINCHFGILSFEQNQTKKFILDIVSDKKRTFFKKEQKYHLLGEKIFTLISQIESKLKMVKIRSNQLNNMKKMDVPISHWKNSYEIQ